MLSKEETEQFWQELLGFWTLSIVRNKKTENKVSETGSISSSGEGKKTSTFLGPLERAKLP
jgi:hypothetical protein